MLCHTNTLPSYPLYRAALLWMNDGHFCKCIVTCPCNAQTLMAWCLISTHLGRSTPRFGQCPPSSRSPGPTLCRLCRCCDRHFVCGLQIRSLISAHLGRSTPRLGQCPPSSRSPDPTLCRLCRCCDRHFVCGLQSPQSPGG